MKGDFQTPGHPYWDRVHRESLTKRIHYRLHVLLFVFLRNLRNLSGPSLECTTIKSNTYSDRSSSVYRLGFQYPAVYDTGVTSWPFPHLRPSPLFDYVRYCLRYLTSISYETYDVKILLFAVKNQSRKFFQTIFVFFYFSKNTFLQWWVRKFIT